MTRNLRDDAGGEHVAQKHFAIAAKRRHAFLDAGAAGIEQADDRRAVLQRHVLDLGDLSRVRFRQRAAEDGEVLGEHIDRAAVDGAPAGDDAVARNPVFSIPKSVQRCSTNMSNSSKEPSSSRIRSARARSACRAHAGR